MRNNNWHSDRGSAEELRQIARVTRELQEGLYMTYLGSEVGVLGKVWVGSRYPYLSQTKSEEDATYFRTFQNDLI